MGKLPLVFVCGLVGGQFPAFTGPIRSFPSTRAASQGKRAAHPFAEDTEKEEKFLFDSAMTRATRALVLSYPKTIHGRTKPALALSRSAEPAVRARLSACSRLERKRPERLS